MTSPDEIRRRFIDVRARSEALAAPLTDSEWRIQSMDDVSPPWWNLGHTSWFFARNLLRDRGLSTDDDRSYDWLLNSYYESLGPRIERSRRGQAARPTNAEVRAYRASVDERMLAVIDEGRDLHAIEPIIRAGLEHEEQHQELMLTEIKHIRFQAPPHLRAPYATTSAPGEPLRPAGWRPVEGGLVEIGADGEAWSWDVERPRHKAFLAPFEVCDRLVTCGEYLEFVEDGGYERPLLWLSNGWDACRREGWSAPLYWERPDGAWRIWTLGGMRELDESRPVSHVSFYEAAAFAAWAAEARPELGRVRLATEREWELAAVRAFSADRGPAPAANLFESGLYEPLAARAEDGAQSLGDLWEWTTSHFEPYPGFRAWEGALTEYNAKFMDNQRVLRGGSAVTPREHIRATYRNFWHAATRFQLSGIRLVRE